MYARVNHDLMSIQNISCSQLVTTDLKSRGRMNRGSRSTLYPHKIDEPNISSSRCHSGRSFGCMFMLTVFLLRSAQPLSEGGQRKPGFSQQAHAARVNDYADMNKRFPKGGGAPFIHVCVVIDPGRM